MAFLTISLIVFPLFADQNPAKGSLEGRATYLQQKIDTLLNDINDDLGGQNASVAQIKKNLQELINKNLQK